MRSASHLTRTLRSLTALVTVWCLGCDAFDPLIAGLLPGAGAAMMVCASEAPIRSTAATAATEDRVLSFVASPTDRDASAGATCDCGSCHAPAPQAAAVPPSLASAPHQPLGDAGVPPSVDRTPLAPPPQRGA
jgi:hypothetical protein